MPVIFNWTFLDSCRCYADRAV